MRRPKVIEELVAMVREDSKGADPTFAARSVANQIPVKTARMLAAQYLTGLCRDDARQRTLREERQAMRQELLAELVATGTPLTAKARRMTVTAEELAEREEREAKHRARMWQTMAGFVERYTEEIRVQWTQELLDSTFALADGSTRTWGAATIKDHRERVMLFSRNAQANIEGAARHQQAIRDIEAAGVGSLNELARAA